jgi:hypothetical protein
MRSADTSIFRSSPIYCRKILGLKDASSVRPSPSWWPHSLWIRWLHGISVASWLPALSKTAAMMALAAIAFHEIASTRRQLAEFSVAIGQANADQMTKLDHVQAQLNKQLAQIDTTIKLQNVLQSDRVARESRMLRNIAFHLGRLNTRDDQLIHLAAPTDTALMELQGSGAKQHDEYVRELEKFAVQLSEDRKTLQAQGAETHLKVEGLIT